MGNERKEVGRDLRRRRGGVVTGIRRRVLDRDGEEREGEPRENEFEEVKEVTGGRGW